MKMVALIPARAGSKRVPGKNIKPLAGHPLIAHTIHAAKTSGVFVNVVVSTDSQEIAGICAPYLTDERLPGAERIIARPFTFAQDDSPDIQWVRHALANLYAGIEAFAILRPTNPFRSAETIRRAYKRFCSIPDVDSLRAVEPVTHHPGKMWLWDGPGYPIVPVLNYNRPDGTPWHSSPTQTLPKAFVQNASLEMAWCCTVTQKGSIAGNKVLPFFTEGYEGVNIDTPEDFACAEQIARDQPELLPLSMTPVCD